MKKLALTMSLLLLAVYSAVAAERLYWEFPEVTGAADGGRFPQLVDLGGKTALVWQEFQGETGSLKSSISIRAMIASEDMEWNGPVIKVTGDIPYLWQEKVPLFSASADTSGSLIVAVAEAGDGVGIYRPDSFGKFRRVHLVASGPQVADTTVAPKLVSSANGELLLFLSRRTVLDSEAASSILTLFLTTSSDGDNWSTPELFIRPGIDVGSTAGYGNLALLEQNFLPAHLAFSGRDYVVFQSLRQGPYGRVYQLYLKIRDSVGNWQPALPVTELLTPSRAESSAGGTTGGEQKDAYSWSNQRPSLGLSAEGEILLVWERSYLREVPNIALTVLDTDGRPRNSLVEDVTRGRNSGACPQVFSASQGTWILWFDDDGIRIAERRAPYAYRIQEVSLDARTPGADRNSAIFPSVRVSSDGKPFILWEDLAGGRARVVFLRPDLQVDAPRLRRANFSGSRPGNVRSLVVDWAAPDDSSGVLSYSWLWSRNPDSLPSRLPEDQFYKGRRTVYTIEDPASEEGFWYFALIVQDQAGNWSRPLRLSYSLDVTPPPPPLIAVPETDEYGYLKSNTFRLNWEDAEKDEAAFYRWRMDYLGASPEGLNLEELGSLPVSDNTVETSARSTSWANLDNGVWAFTVAAVDAAGNQGLPNTELLFTRKYVPVTFITGVSAQKDDKERLTLRITGRGFAVGGKLNAVILDRDGQPPWDYEYPAFGAGIRVVSDRVVEVSGIESMEKGLYRVGVRHPVRGIQFWKRRMKLDASGNVKFGPFGLYSYESLWEPAAESLGLSGNTFLLVLLVLLPALAVGISVVRLIVLAREARIMGQNAWAILNRESLSRDARREAVIALRRKGMRLRIKFLLWLTVLIVITILLVAVFLGLRWINMEREALAGSMESASRILVESIASSAVNNIYTADRGALLLLPDRIEALPDALWTTVTGPRAEIRNGDLRSTSDGYEYIWASNDPDILDKILLPPVLDAAVVSQVKYVANEEEMAVFRNVYPENPDGSASLVSFSAGSAEGQKRRSVLAALLRRVNILPSEIPIGIWETEDDITPDIEQLREEVEQAVQDAGISRMIAELTVLEARRAEEAARVIRTLDFDDPVFVEAGEAVAAQKKEIETLLLEVANSRFAVYPEFSPEQLRLGGPDYFVFYKPLLYREGNQDTGFFKGTVRVAVSVAGIREALFTVQNRIIFTSFMVSILALGIGVAAALLLSTVIARPIIKLGAKVQEIQDEKDKEQLRDFDTGIRSNDEIGILSDNINAMVQGLVQAAKEQKELLAGQGIQKTFIPILDVQKNKRGDDVRLSTGSDSNAFFKLFGYYEGADAVSGDFFGFRRLDEDHRALMKLDISGHGVTAAMIMVQAASLFVDYFRHVENRVKDGGRLEFDLSQFTFGLNDLMMEINFRGRFAAFNLSVINVRTGEYQMIHAGDNLVHIYDPGLGRMRQLELQEAPAAGTFDSSLIEMQNEMKGLNMYQPVAGRLKKGEILFLYTDGIEEAHHLLRNENGEEVRYSYFPQDMIEKDNEFIERGFKTMRDVQTAGSPKGDTDQDDDKQNPRWEEFDTVRIEEIIEAVMHRREYVLVRRLDLTIGKPLHFDFSTLESGGESAILALAAVEQVFRLVPNPQAASHARIRVDRKIDSFLKKHFREYHEYFHHPVSEESDIDYVYFSHLLDDPQDDDLTIWAFEKL